MEEEPNHDQFFDNNNTINLLLFNYPEVTIPHLMDEFSEQDDIILHQGIYVNTNNIKQQQRDYFFKRITQNNELCTKPMKRSFENEMFIQPITSPFESTEEQESFISSN
ncbi:hypothetical protein EHI8A_093140 [Entamoeba histolytica HM-1:IMSS-B]|uniref:Uncharacterized protein n=6 Tax=Entamoeba histolytica TaxID=5759 RepID=C4M7Z9_ENTH1|nr:hypothetical protein EHI_167670 [Entamoeba histolytica HM-1:IMSS]EMD45694.1 Hypothetical protein EHI5A_128780 [Entamoeba histolytica KU27]EMH75561.1 hypothetical protein EHI8A_093140 [Entamoeba histolytica HM-1:IMSS-B]EMS15231.1 hypothetical protein KM1_161620 [Entamoeba histolytica HM-3:IMSS]ENY65844.1 hypothetical protein EHI7A_090970 [Entamoeba histolytica HM-1:IMSS-A]GAT97679.1 hypothetical protein CL6EHI_167670 [Entamoeba histolytica]|eukprot:XP_655556.1 hypothetical protein EHI_167670 [Entamoeba histolytica HM-1:IMSS]